MADIQEADIFRLKALEKKGNELYTWTWPVKETKELILNPNRQEISDSPIRLSEHKEVIDVSACQYDFVFEKNSGNLLKVIIDDEEILLSGGVVTRGINLENNSVNWHLDNYGNFHLKIQNENARLHWAVYKDSRLRYEADVEGRNNRLKDCVLEEFPGVSFNYPEKDIRGVKWLGDDPYRVWKNRLKGVEFGIWQKDYYNTVTGESYNDLVYMEFKGYHSNVYWMELETSGNPIRIKTETPDLYVQLYKPERPKHIKGGPYPAFPDRDISFLYEIPAMGTKFKKANQMGPSGTK
ncbi:MAG: hypothetical protein K9H49_02755 [Bacteroidales bacterium]|nr:hypothetical protein [Bacteroidales bacterium]MCF8389178.1 hypothetical protein [Bacteroidales bacterium]